MLSIQRHSYFLWQNVGGSKKAGCRGVAFGGCAFVPQLFQQLINTMLCPAFFR